MEKYTCDCCKKEYADNDTTWYNIVPSNDENDIKGAICQHCLDENSETDLYNKLGYVTADYFDSKETQTIRACEKIRKTMLA